MSNNYETAIRVYVEECAGEASASAPAFSELRSRVATRRRRRYGKMAMAGSGAAILLVSGWVALSLPQEAEDSMTSTKPSVITIPHYPENWGGDQALLEGQLRFTDQEGCPYVERLAEKQPVYLNFDRGYTGRSDEQGRAEILDASGAVVAVEGQQVEVGGGGGSFNGSSSEDWSPPCYPEEPQYIVTEIEGYPTP